MTRADLIGANRVAESFFRAILRDHPEGEAARALVERRGISPEMVERFSIGAAPPRWDGLASVIRKKNLNEAAFLALGLIKKKERPEPYDALRNRLIFPIHGETGDPIAFGGRRVDDAEEPKYLNSPETPLFNKSRCLFGLPMARDAIRASGRAVVVEGYTDVIACHQAGLTNVVGTLGTAFTAGHAGKLRGQCDEIVLLFDGDEAGQNAADRAIGVLIGSRVDIRVAMLTGATEAKDPDELLATPGGVDTLRGILDRAEPVIERWARRVRERQSSMGPAARARFLDEQVARLAESGLASLSPIERDSLLGSLADALGVPGRVMVETFASARRSGRRAVPGERVQPGERSGQVPARLRSVDRFRLQLLSGLMDVPDPSVFDTARVRAALRVDLGGAPGPVAAMVERACSMLDEGEPVGAAALLAAVDSPDAASWLAGALASGGPDEGDPAVVVLDAVDRLEAHALLTGDAGRTGTGATIDAEAGRVEVKPDAPADRLDRLRRLHAEHGGNLEANPFRGRAGGSGLHDRRGSERGDDGQIEADDIGAAPGAG